MNTGNTNENTDDHTDPPPSEKDGHPQSIKRSDFKRGGEGGRERRGKPGELTLPAHPSNCGQRLDWSN